MKIDVIISCYNEERTIKSIIIKSIKNLSKEDNLIIVDDASADKSNFVIKKITNKFSNINLIKYVDTENLYLVDEVVEVSFQESLVDIEVQKNLKGTNIYKKYKSKYFILFNKLQLYFDNKKTQFYLNTFDKNHQIRKPK